MLWFEITKMQAAVITVSFSIIFSTLSFRFVNKSTHSLSHSQVSYLESLDGAVVRVEHDAGQ